MTDGGIFTTVMNVTSTSRFLNPILSVDADDLASFIRTKSDSMYQFFQIEYFDLCLLYESSIDDGS